MNIETIIAIVSLIISLLSLLGTMIIFQVTRYRENYQNLLEQLKTYQSNDFLIAIHNMWCLYREFGEEKFTQKYIEIMEADFKKADLLPDEQRLTFERTTLHHQRRIITQYWRGIGVLLKNNLVPSKAFFDLWALDDVDIIQKILIPLNDKLVQYYQVAPPDPKREPLYFVIKVAKKAYHLR